MIAADLKPGDTFTLPSGAVHQAEEVNRLSHRVSIRTRPVIGESPTVGTWVTLTPTVRVEVA